MGIRKKIVIGALAVSALFTGSLAAFAGYDSRFFYPQSTYDAVVKTANNYSYLAAATGSYNCLAYVKGYTDIWLWPWGSSNPTLSQMDLYMNQDGYLAYSYSQGSSGTKIIAYGTSTNNITHVAKPADNNYSNAKWGQLERLQSLGWDPYSSSTYGSALRIYK